MEIVLKYSITQVLQSTIKALMGYSFNKQVTVPSTFLALIEEHMKPREVKEYR